MQRNKKHGVLSVLLALVMILTMLSACASDPDTPPPPETDAVEDSGDDATPPSEDTEVTEDTDEPGAPVGDEEPGNVNPISDYPVSFTILWNDHPQSPWQEDWIIWPEMERITNVTLIPEIVPDADFETRLALLYSTGDMPDLLTTANAPPEVAAAGLLLATCDYLDHLPNLQPKVTGDGFLAQWWEFQRQGDGKIYVLPNQIIDRPLIHHAWGFRGDILDDFGVSTPETWDELHYILTRVRDEMPEIVAPIINRTGTGGMLAIWSGSFGTFAGWSLGGFGHKYDWESDEWIFAPTTENWRLMITELQRFYEEGLLCPEIFTMDGDILMNHAASGTMFATIDWPQAQRNVEYILHETHPHAYYVFGRPIAGPDGYAQFPALANVINTFTIPARMANHEHFDVFLRWLNWIYSEEASILFGWGIEGVSYEWIDGERAYMPHLQTAANPDGPVWPGTLGLRQVAFAPVMLAEVFAAGSLDGPRREFQESMADVDRWFARAQPTVTIPENRVDEVAMLFATLEDYYMAALERFTYGFDSMDDWDAFVERVNNMGAPRLTEIINEAWQNR